MKPFLLFMHRMLAPAICLLLLNRVSGQSAITPFVLGQIHEIRSEVLNETRILNIYLPEGYKASDTVRYPVVYLLDGGADEDFIHVVGLYQFNNFPWIQRVPPSIVVGIANIDRKRDFTFPATHTNEQQRFPTSGHSNQFRKFLSEELQPYIRKQFRTNADQTLIGQSLAGLFACETVLKQPELFNRYIIISPSLWWDDGSLLKAAPELLNAHPSAHAAIYLGVGKEGLAPCDAPHVMEVDANLLAETIRSARGASNRLIFDYLPDENHATITHQAVFNALRSLFPVPLNK